MSILESLPAGMADGLRRSADIVRKHDSVRIISHYDSDGISSAAIVREALRRLGKRTETTIFPTLSLEQMAVVGTMDAECVVMTDLGTSFLETLARRDWDIVILDHHKPKEESDVPVRSGFAFVNPLLYGIDGSKNACGSAMAYLFAITLDPSNSDLVPLAIAGMYGDKQHLGGFQSIDRLIVDDALASGAVRKVENLAYPSGMTFYQAMMSCPEPYFKGTTGQADKVNRFIKSCEIGMAATPLTVDRQTIDRFAEELAARMRRNGVTEAIIKETFGDRYYSDRYQMDISELSSMLDGCGRSGSYDKAFNACDTLDFTEASIDAQAYSDRLIAAIEPAFGSMVELKNIQYFVINEQGMAGNIASAIVRYLGNPEKPVIGLTVSGKEITDISSRGTPYQIEKGLNLSEAMREVCGDMGGQGGGHVIASGGIIPRGSEDAFLKALDDFIGHQFAR